MSLDISKLQNVRTRPSKTTARCPACAASGADTKGEHLVITPQGRFGCVIYPGNGPDAKQHRRRIFALCGDREMKPLLVLSAKDPLFSGRSGRPFRSYPQRAPIKAGILGRLGRAFGSHAQRQSTIERTGFSVSEQNCIKRGVLAVPESQLRRNRPLTEREVSILRRAGAESDPIIITALNLFNGMILDGGQ
jgi:hypothetical protein